MFNICPNCRHLVLDNEFAAYSRCEDCWVLNFVESDTPRGVKREREVKQVYDVDLNLLLTKAKESVL